MAKFLGYIAYEGPSEIDGAPIVVIVNKLDGSDNAKTGAIIRPGDTILWHGKGRAELAGEPTIPAELAAAAELDHELAASDPEAAAAAGRYLAASMARGVSHIWNTGGREYYRNKRGRCEDAPCCGCCNA